MKALQNILFFALVVCNSAILKAQGLLNSSASIVTTNGANIYIDGTTGNYTSQGTGVITSNTAGGVVTVLGNWINNASNAGFSNDGVTVNMSGAAQTIGGSASTTFFNLNLAGTGTKTLQINTIVGGISSLTGVLSVGTRTMDLNSNLLTITNPAAGGITYSSGMIISETNLAVNPSKIQWNMGNSTGAHIFPFGVSNTQIPFTFNKTTAGSANITVSTRATVSSNNQPWAGASNVAAVSIMESNAGTYYPDASIPSVIDRWWDITTSAAVTANMIFSYRGIENTTTNNPTGPMYAQHWNGSSWDAPVGSGTGVTSGVGTVSVTGASTFSPWIISSLMIPLPVELIDFSSECKNTNTRLSWTSVTEFNNDYFLLERSVDGINYDQIAHINTLAQGGNSSGPITYSYIDEVPQSNATNYYRLKQVDKNGLHNTFGPFVVQGCGKSEEFAIYNAENGFILFSDSQNECNADVRIYNSLGQILNTSGIQIVKGINRFHFPISYGNGIYYVSVIKQNMLVLIKKVII